MKLTHPESRSHKCDHALHTTGLLALWCHALIDRLAQPDICSAVPVIEEDLETLSGFNGHDVDVPDSVPLGPTSDRIIAIEAETS